MAVYAFDENFNILGLVADYPVNQGTVNTVAVDLSQITKVDPVTGLSYTLPEFPKKFNVNDLPGSGVVATLSSALPTDTMAFPQKAQATRSTDQTMTSAAWTQITWNAMGTNPARVGVQVATVPGLGAGVLQPQTAGQYMANCNISVLAGATAVEDLGVRLLINGQVHATSLATDSMATAVERGMSIVSIMDLAAGDSVTVEVFCTAAEAPKAKASRSWFSLVQLH